MRTGFCCGGVFRFATIFVKVLEKLNLIWYNVSGDITEAKPGGLMENTFENKENMLDRIHTEIKNISPAVIQEDPECEDVGMELASALQWSKIILQSQMLHQKGNICFDLSKVVLELYRKIRYENMEMFLEQSIDLMRAMNIIDSDAGIDSQDFKLHMCCADNFGGRFNILDKWAGTSSGENMFLLILMTENALNIVKEADEQMYEILYEKYIRRENAGLYDKDLEKILHINHRYFGTRRDKAITEFSKAFFGSLGERLKGTYFSDGEDSGIDVRELIRRARIDCEKSREKKI